MSKSIWRGVWVLAVACSFLAAAPPGTQPSAGNIQATIEYLTADGLQGRGPGTKGIDMARDFIIKHFRDAGLKVLPGMKDFRQDFDLTAVDDIGPATRLAAGGKTFGRGSQYTPFSFSAEKRFDAPLLFAGYGITRSDYDDYAGADAKGKVVLAMRFEPHDKDGHSRVAGAGWSSEATTGAKARNAANHGATAILLVTPARFHDDDSLPPLVSDFSEPPAEIPVIQITRPAAEQMLKAAGAPPLAELQAAIDDAGRPHPLALDKMKILGEVALERQRYPLSNIVGYLPGSGALADQYIVVGAHYDHLGERTDVPGRKMIYHGADDNASGTAAVLELARILPAIIAASPAAERRSIIVVSFSGEERGLIGSAHFVEHPPVPLEKIVAMINFDMVGRLRGDRLFVLGQGLSSTFGPLLRDARAAAGLDLRPDYTGGLAPSDQVSFLNKGIPSLDFFTGNHADYHRPTDTADKINFAGEEKVVRLAGHFIAALAEAPKVAPMQREP